MQRLKNGVFPPFNMPRNRRIRVFKEEISFKEILFISDIEGFTPAHNAKLLKQITDKRIKLVVMAGDINSFLENGRNYFAIYDNATFAASLFFDSKEIKRLAKEKEVGVSDMEKFLIGQKISKKIEQEHGKALEEFFLFVDRCKERGVEILYYSGNHDSMLAYPRITFESDYIPLLERFRKKKNLHINPDLQVIYLNPNLFITGIHVSVGSEHCNENTWLRERAETLEEVIPYPEKTIFVSHIPGNLKYTKLGSADIRMFKRRYNFKYHFHGHCKDYYGEYLEEGVPTKSVHIREENLE